MISTKKFYENHPTKRCKYCLRDLKLEESTKDHVLPIYRGGTDFIDNLVLCCTTCNDLKGCLTLKGFYIKVDRILKTTKNKHYFKTIRNSTLSMIYSKKYKLPSKKKRIRKRNKRKKKI